MRVSSTCTLCGSDLHTHAGRRTRADAADPGARDRRPHCPRAFGPETPRVEILGAVPRPSATVSPGPSPSVVSSVFLAPGRVCRKSANGLINTVITPCRPSIPPAAAWRIRSSSRRVLPGCGCRTPCPIGWPRPRELRSRHGSGIVAAHAGAVEGRSVLVLGAGVLGVTACAPWPRGFGAQAVLACDPMPECQGAGGGFRRDARRPGR